MKYLLDTNAVTAWAKKDSSVIARLQRLAPSDLAISVLTEHELLYGIAYNPQFKLRGVLERLLAMLPKLPLDSAIVAKAALVRADLRRRGLPIGPYDLLIAATALEHGLTMVTHNAREFERVSGLQVEDWQFSA
ncbi:MAG: type II toxin-antitoxin system VapC family toxin [Polaromonas sp.]